jgi:hypothetical protein
MPKDIFPDWSEMGRMAAIEEAQGDVSLACTRISEVQAEQWLRYKECIDQKGRGFSVTNSNSFKKNFEFSFLIY